MKLSVKTRSFFIFLAALVVTAAAMNGCGNDDDASIDGVDGSYNPEETKTRPDVTPGKDTGSNTVASFESEWLPTGAGQVYVEYYVPTDCTKESPCPGLVLIPDGLGAGTDYFECCAQQLSEYLHTIVITYNPPGRGTPGEVSDGEIDFGGSVAQDVLKDVANTLRKKSLLDESNFGFLSVGFGISAASGALARFQDTTLGFVGYYIDVEGPPNRCFISQSPFLVNEEENYYVNEDGKGVSTTRCDFDLWVRKEKFPAGTSSDGKGEDGTPNAYICNPNAFVLRESGKTCEDDKWWQEREAKTYLIKLTSHYLRIQFVHDHKQPTRFNAREAMHWITQANAASYQINSVTLNQNLKGYGEDDLPKGVYLNPKAGNGFGTDVFDTVGDFKELTMKELMLNVLPPYIERMQKRSGGR